jgi:hypothetical protein
MVTNDALRMTVVKVFDACAHTIYIVKILWAKKLCIGKRSVYEPYWDVIVVGYPIIRLGLSAFNYRIIHIHRISLTPYHIPHPHTIGFGLSTSAWISKTLLNIRIIRIRIGSDVFFTSKNILDGLPNEPCLCSPYIPYKVRVNFINIG